jgi:hypothetical protein
MQNPDIEWTRLQVYYPEPLLPQGVAIAYQLRQRVLQFLGLAINQPTINRIRFDTPGPVYQITAAARDNTGAALPMGLDSLDTFRVRFEHSSGDRLTEQAAMGSALCGVASFPALLSRNGWHFDNGGVMIVEVTALRANLDIDIVCWHFEARGPTNLVAG